ncbi:PH domain-containing protein [Crateriforma conspicua]|uniref:Bacterial membrane flanked domain protein n=1 Tax=Crateriforma conspicua TaxID=2527996 RepID=A0A5C6FYE2_9PLAN|nr:PH domain-containing protein [Crateriforma conspicua]TWU67561.1 Bacterial membrane flanked domain protein [Crateriforma conspicua]
MSDEKVLWKAEFNPKVKSYWLLSGTIVMLCTIILIPLIPVWFVLGMLVTDRYLKSCSCELTDRSLKVGKGILVRTEKTVPLDRITDLGLVQGPIMRMLDIEALSVETAGQSSQGSLVQLTGIKNGRAFRDAVLEQRDRVSIQESAPVQTSDAGIDASASQTLVEIRDILRRMESRLEQSQIDA